MCSTRARRGSGRSDRDSDPGEGMTDTPRWAWMDGEFVPWGAAVSRQGQPFNARLAIVPARIDGYDNAILLNAEGKVTEASAACLFLVRDGMAVTSGILDSITRATLLRLFRDELGAALEDETSTAPSSTTRTRSSSAERTPRCCPSSPSTATRWDPAPSDELRRRSRTSSSGTAGTLSGLVRTGGQARSLAQRGLRRLHPRSASGAVATARGVQNHRCSGVRP